MRSTAFAYAALGLEPGADRAAIEQAYRRLIKLHHPDRSGGDSARAAEINRAYFELRRTDEPAGSRIEEFRSPAPRRPRAARAGRPKRRRRRRGGWLPVLVIASAGWLLVDGRLVDGARPWIGSLAELWAPGPGSGGMAAARVDSSAIDGPLEESAIAGSIDRAVRLAARGDEEALAQHSRDCHRQLRLRPRLAQLDRCAAFDNAVAMVADREPSSDRGAFNASAVTSRQMNAASLLSSDYLAIERRLNRIRTIVELALIPRPAPIAPLPVAEDQPLAEPIPSDPELAPSGF